MGVRSCGILSSNEMGGGGYCRILTRKLACTDLYFERIFWLLWYKQMLGKQGNGTPLQYSCLQNPMGGGAWQAAVHGVTKSGTTERLHFDFSLSCTGEGNGNPLQCSCLENPRDQGAWWAAVYEDLIQVIPEWFSGFPYFLLSLEISYYHY